MASFDSIAAMMSEIHDGLSPEDGEAWNDAPVEEMMAGANFYPMTFEEASAVIYDTFEEMIPVPKNEWLGDFPDELRRRNHHHDHHEMDVEVQDQDQEPKQEESSSKTTSINKTYEPMVGISAPRRSERIVRKKAID